MTSKNQFNSYWDASECPPGTLAFQLLLRLHIYSAEWDLHIMYIQVRPHCHRNKIWKSQTKWLRKQRQTGWIDRYMWAAPNGHTGLAIIVGLAWYHTSIYIYMKNEKHTTNNQPPIGFGRKTRVLLFIERLMRRHMWILWIYNIHVCATMKLRIL